MQKIAFQRKLGISGANCSKLTRSKCSAWFCSVLNGGKLTVDRLNGDYGWF